jgi:dipeptidyl-peptidase-4
MHTRFHTYSGCVLALAAAVLAAPFADASEAGRALTIERLESSPSLSGPRVRGAKVSPDGKRVTFLRGKETDFEHLDLWEFDVDEGEARLLVDSESLVPADEEALSEEEIARRERQRLRGKGILHYYWSDDGDALLFPLGGDIFHLRLGGEPKRLTDTESFETDVRFSPRGRYASFIRERDLYVVEIETGEETRLTEGATDTIGHGVAEFIAMEELDRDTGYWWSPDESRIAFTRIDESGVALLDRYEIAPDGSVTTSRQRYPPAGTANATIELGVVELATGEITWIDLGEDADIYLARVDWLPDSESLTFQRLPRDQRSLDLVLARADGSEQRRLLRETSDVWINLHHDLRFLEDSPRFLWTSERSGYRHVYLYEIDGQPLGPLTQGDWVVEKIVSVDESGGQVFFSGFADGTLEKHLYAVDLDADEPTQRRITRESGWHTPRMAGRGGPVVLDGFSSPEQPPQLALRSSEDGRTLGYVSENPLDATHPYYPYWSTHAPSRFGTLEAEDGQTLDYRLILPPDFDESRQYPVVFAPYGGPHGHLVRKDWRLGLNQVLAREGFVVFVLDNRGSDHRGVAFERPVRHAMGRVEVRDQVRGVESLRSLPWIDGKNIGMHGWSYGGYLAVHVLAQAPDHFRAVVAGAPVTDWRLYDTAYTERYLGHPDAPGDVYEMSSVFPYLDDIQGELLLIHGMADDNVFFDHSVKLMADLQRRGIPFELMTYPGQKHDFRDRDMRIHARQLTLDFFERHLR